MPFVEARRCWERRCSRMILVLDLLAVTLALGVTQLLWWDAYWRGVVEVVGPFGRLDIGYPAVTLALAVAWWSPSPRPGHATRGSWRMAGRRIDGSWS